MVIISLHRWVLEAILLLINRIEVDHNPETVTNIINSTIRDALVAQPAKDLVYFEAPFWMAASITSRVEELLVSSA